MYYYNKERNKEEKNSVTMIIVHDIVCVRIYTFFMINEEKFSLFFQYHGNLN